MIDNQTNYQQRDTVTKQERDNCETILRHKFKDPAFLEKALTHSSIKTMDGDCNERMEFLGDAILGMVISEFLYKNFPEYSEGELTRIKSVVVSRPILAVCAHDIELEQFIRVGRGLGQRKLPRSVLANVFEAVIAAIYEDAGLQSARAFILRNLKGQVEVVVQDEHEKNYKSLLQQHTQKVMAATPSYRVISQSGPDHAKQFEVATVINSIEHARGEGHSKKEAEQRAAEKTLQQLTAQHGANS